MSTFFCVNAMMLTISSTAFPNEAFSRPPSTSPMYMASSSVL